MKYMMYYKDFMRNGPTLASSLPSCRSFTELFNFAPILDFLICKMDIIVVVVEFINYM